MKCFVLAAVFCLPIPQFAQQSVPEIKFEAQTDFFKLPRWPLRNLIRRDFVPFARDLEHEATRMVAWGTLLVCRPHSVFSFHCCRSV